MKKFLIPFCFIFVVVMGNLFVGCKKETDNSKTFTLDLSNSNYSALNTPTGYVYYHEVIIARITTSTFAAVDEYCTKDHYAIIYNPSINFFVCSSCGGRYNLDGTVAFGPPPSALKKYNTSLSGNMLSVSP